MRVFLRRLWDTFISGLLAILPIGLTFYILWYMYHILNSMVGRHTPFGDMVERALGRWIPGMGLYMLVLLILVVGLIMRNFLGRALEYYLDRILSSIPGVRGMYTALKQFTRALLGRDAASFQKVVMFEYPKDGMWVIGLVTNENVGRLHDTTGEESVLVYAPTAPNPLSGMMLVIPKKKVTYLNMPVEDALSMVISSGAVLPDSLRTDNGPPPPRRLWLNPFSRRRSKE